MTLGRLLVAFLCFASPAHAQRDHPDRRLQRELAAIVQGFHGDVGVYVRHLRTGATAPIQADDTFPTASMIKVPIMIGTFDAIAQDRFAFTDTAPEPRAVAKYPEDDILAGLSDIARITVGRLVTLSVTYSDNSASLWLQQLAGGGSTINGWLERNGFGVTRVNARTPGREGDYERWGWGQTTPREMARLVTLIRERKVVDYVFCVITKNQQDETWEPGNEGYVLLRHVSAALWRRFEPRHPWAPAPGAETFKP